MEVEHHPFQFAFGHLAMGNPDARLGDEILQFALHATDRFDVVVQEVHLAATGKFALEGFAQLHVVPRHDEGLHREPMRGRGGDDREVAQAGHRHVERARDRGRRQGQQVYVGAQCFQCFLLAHAEALFLVDDDQAQVFEAHVLLQQPVGANDDVEGTVGDPADLGFDFLRGLEARQHLDPHGPVGKTVAEVAVVLLGKQRGRHQHRDLLAGDGGDEGRTHGNLGLAEADVAADDEVHRLRGRQLADHHLDRGMLVGGLLERE